MVTSITDSRSSFTAFNASRPAIAPDGRYTVLPKSLQASDITSKTDSSSKAPADIIIKSFLFCNMLTASFRTASCDAASTTKSSGFEESK